MTMRLTLPRWLLPTEIGLGDALKRGTTAVGLKPCIPCAQRAERLNQLLVATPAAGRARTGDATLAIPANGGAVMATGTAQTSLRPGKSEVEHLPRDEGTPASDTDKCCTYSVTLINRRRAKPLWLPFWWPIWLWPWLQAYKVRVTATGGTTILNADPGDWEQTAALPTSVTWDPGTGGAIPTGDATDSWIIDNDFLLSLGPVNSSVKTLTIEWLGLGGVVIDAFQVRIPCLMGGKDDDSETNWDQYTSVVKGGTNVSVYLEPDDCDDGDFDYRAACSIQATTPVCSVDGNGNNAYSVTFTAPTASAYEWRVNNVIQSNPADTLTVILAPGSYTISLQGFNNDNTVAFDCSSQLDLTGLSPDFSWEAAPCSKKLKFNGAETENYTQVTNWSWTCSNPLVQIPSTVAPQADFAAVPDGSYDITLRVTDQFGCVWEQTQTVKVSSCEASWETKYSWCVDKIDPNAHKDIVVTFTNSSTGCAPFTCVWDFADGTTGSQINPTHTYTNAAHGQEFQVKLKLTDSAGCTTEQTITLTIEQREMPQFTVKVCPDGKVICETNEPSPQWSTSGSPAIAPWPYTKPKKHRSRIIYRFDDGTYTVILKSKNENGNECQARKVFTMLHDCCAKNAHTSGTSQPIPVQLNNQSKILRVRGKLRQRQIPLWHRVKAKSILQIYSNGKWRRFKSSAVILEVYFGHTAEWPTGTGTVFKSESSVLAFDGSYFVGCNCAVQTDTSGHSAHPNKKKVRDSDGLGGRFRSKVDTIRSLHAITVAGTQYQMLNLSLGHEKNCNEWKWWSDWY